MWRSLTDSQTMGSSRDLGHGGVGRAVRLVGIMLTGIALTACTTAGDPKTAAASGDPASASPELVPSGRLDGGPPAEAPVESVDAISRDRVLLPGKVLGRRVSVAALGERGEVLLSLLDPRPADVGLRQGRLALATSAAGARAAKPLPLGPRRAAPQQVSGAAVTPRHVVWTETPSTSLGEDPWVMYAYDRRDGVTREITRAPRLGNGHVPGPVPGFTSAVAHRGRIAWAQMHGREPVDARVDVLTCRITSCRPTLAVRGAAFPAITKRGVLAVRQDRQSAGGASIVLRRTHGGLRTVHRLLPDDVAITGFTASGDAWALTQRRVGVDDTTATTALVSREGRVEQIVGQPGENFGYPVLGTGFAAWAETSGVTSPLGAYVHSFATGRTYQAGNRKGLYGLKASGRHLAWQEDTTPGAADIEGIRWTTAEVAD